MSTLCPVCKLLNHMPSQDEWNSMEFPELNIHGGSFGHRLTRKGCCSWLADWKTKATPSGESHKLSLGCIVQSHGTMVRHGGCPKKHGCCVLCKTSFPAEGQEVPLATAFLAEYAAQLACSPVPNYDQLCAIWWPVR